jgi:hypothetical protein
MTEMHSHDWMKFSGLLAKRRQLCGLKIWANEIVFKTQWNEKRW